MSVGIYVFNIISYCIHNGSLVNDEQAAAGSATHCKGQSDTLWLVHWFGVAHRLLILAEGRGSRLAGERVGSATNRLIDPPHSSASRLLQGYGARIPPQTASTTRSTA